MGSTLRVGMVGLDTSHCLAFAAMLNDGANEHHLEGARVVAAYPGGSPEFSLSRDRVQGYTQELQAKYGLKMYDDLRALANDVDAILLESVDGRQHLAQFRQLAVGKPVFIDKPLATSTVEASEIIRVSQDTGTPIMSSSSLRYAAGIADLVPEGEAVAACEAFGPATLLPDYPGLFWYGIHSAEILVSLMGVGCECVRCLAYRDMDVVVGVWSDGRIGVMRGTRLAKGEFGAVAHTAAGVRCGTARRDPPGYYLLLQRVLGFFRSGVSPVDIGQTLSIVAFLEAADQSRARNGETVPIGPVV